jgi:hypothetical protein
MEIALNLAWLGITLALLGLWRFRWVVSRRHARNSFLLQAVSLICVLALLFPVISLTDDLHPEIIAVDSVSGKRNACLMAAASSPARDVSAHPGAQSIYFLLSRPAPGASFTAASRIEIRLSYFASRVPMDSSTGRSPPSFL